MKVIAFAAFLALSPAVAHADKDRDTAFWLSATGTAASTAIVFASVFTAEPGKVNEPVLYVGLGASLFTPSLGQYYAGQYFTIGEGIRGAAAIATVLAVRSGQESARCNTVEPNMSCTAWTPTSIAVIGIAAIRVRRRLGVRRLRRARAADRATVRTSSGSCRRSAAGAAGLLRSPADSDHFSGELIGQARQLAIADLTDLREHLLAGAVCRRTSSVACRGSDTKP
jgi:hypothetical protein